MVAIVREEVIGCALEFVGCLRIESEGQHTVV